MKKIEQCVMMTDKHVPLHCFLDIQDGVRKLLESFEKKTFSALSTIWFLSNRREESKKFWQGHDSTFMAFWKRTRVLEKLG